MRKIIITLALFLFIVINLFSASGDIILKLETDDGSSALHIEDSSSVKLSSITSDGEAYFAKDVDIDGTLDVDGAVTLNNDITSTGDLTVSTITSTENTYFLKDVDMNEDLTVSTITSTGNLDITGRILPNSIAGTDGQGLTTYTSSMTWTTLPSDKWEGTPNIYYTGGNVGIGTNNPSQVLEINGNMIFSVSVAGEGDLYKVDKLKGNGTLILSGDATGEDVDIHANGVGIGASISDGLTVDDDVNMTDGIIVLNGAEQESYSNSVADDGIVVITNSGESGWGFVIAENAEAYAKFYWNDSGTVTLIQSLNAATGNDDGYLCIYYTDTTLKIKNRLNGTKVITFTLTKTI